MAGLKAEALLSFGGEGEESNTGDREEGETDEELPPLHSYCHHRPSVARLPLQCTLQANQSELKPVTPNHSLVPCRPKGSP